jgi:hypothetical protein
VDLNFEKGGGVIGDIYKLTERGTAMEIFFAVNIHSPAVIVTSTPQASLLGNAISPIVGGKRILP